MIERLLESWLTSISEREFDIPFRWLLEQLGFIPFGRKTTHGPMELGKDVVAQESETGLIHFFQVKAGDATPGDWRDMQTQLLQLVEVDYLHPNYKPGDPYKPVWVVTGEMRETVRTSLGLKNADYRRREMPEVEVWEQNDLIERFKKTLFDVPMADELFLIDFIRLWSRARDYLTDEGVS